jgi:hypothetical protein
MGAGPRVNRGPARPLPGRGTGVASIADRDRGNQGGLVAPPYFAKRRACPQAR